MTNKQNTKSRLSRRSFIKGAAGLIMISDEPLYIRFSVEESFIPCAVVGADSLQYFADNPVGLFEFCDAENFPCSTAGEPSAFASYGVTGDLRLKPDISAPGTEISLLQERERGWPGRR